MTAEEMDFMAKRLKPLLVPELLWLGGAPPARRHASSRSAFMLMLPDYNVAIAPTRGRLLPFGWLKFLLARSPDPDRPRRHARRQEAVPAVAASSRIMMADSLRFLLKKGYTGAEVSWLLEDNELVIGAVKPLGRQALQDLPDLREGALGPPGASAGPGASPRRIGPVVEPVPERNDDERERRPGDQSIT